MTTDTSEKGLECPIVADMLATGWLVGDAKQYARDFCADLEHLCAFVDATQPNIAGAVDLNQDTQTPRAFLARLEKEIGKRETEKGRVGSRLTRMDS